MQGLGTALKILFSGKFDDVDPTSGKLAVRHKNRFQLDRREVVALFNGFGRYYELSLIVCIAHEITCVNNDGIRVVLVNR